MPWVCGMECPTHLTGNVFNKQVYNIVLQSLVHILPISKRGGEGRGGGGGGGGGGAVLFEIS